MEGRSLFGKFKVSKMGEKSIHVKQEQMENLGVSCYSEYRRLVNRRINGVT